MAETSIIGYISLAISAAAFFVSIFTFFKRQKSDQFRIFLDIYTKLEEINYQRRLELDDLHSDDSHLETHDQLAKDQLEEYIKQLELVSFLINNGEITNKSIIKYFEPLLTTSANKILEKYPDIEKNRRIKGLRKFQKNRL